MGGPFARALAIPVTLGLSELSQKKPFQDLHEDKPVDGMGGTPLRFIPIAGQVAQTASAVLGSGAVLMTPNAPALHTMPVLGQQNAGDTTAQQKLDALAEAERVRAGRGRAANMLTSPDDAPAPKVKKYLGGY